MQIQDKFTASTIAKAISKSQDYFLSIQYPEGYWWASEFTGTGFPRHFYLKYHFYSQYFHLIVLGQYQAISY